MRPPVRTQHLERGLGQRHITILIPFALDNHILDPRSAKSTKLTIGVAADLEETRQRYAKGYRWVRDASISPTGARAALEFRGEIVTVPAEKGDPRNLSNTPGTHERSPIWSPDGKQIAYFSDASGEYQLCVQNQDGKGEIRRYPLTGAGFYDAPDWSPDNLKISYVDNSQALRWIDLKSGAAKVIGSNYLMGSAVIQHSWSPDSKWIAYTRSDRVYIQAVYVYSLDQDKSFAVTDGLSEVAEPVFDTGGKYLYFFGSTDAGPVKQWFDLSATDLRKTSSLYLVVLRKDIPSPLAKESDEEKGIQKEEKPREAAPAAAQPFAIDLEGIQYRILDIQIPGGDYSDLQVGASGQIFYLKAIAGAAPGTGPELHRYDLGKRKDDTLDQRSRGLSDLGRHQERFSWRRGTRCRSSPCRPGTGFSLRQASSTSMRSRSWSIHAPNGRRYSTRPGGSTAITFTPPTCTGRIGLR